MLLPRAALEPWRHLALQTSPTLECSSHPQEKDGLTKEQRLIRDAEALKAKLAAKAAAEASKS